VNEAERTVGGSLVSVAFSGIVTRPLQKGQAIVSPLLRKPLITV
jgi:hypothetical protein